MKSAFVQMKTLWSPQVFRASQSVVGNVVCLHWNLPLWAQLRYTSYRSRMETHKKKAHI